MPRSRSSDARNQLRHYSALSSFSHTLLCNQFIDQKILFRLALSMVLEFVQATRGRLLITGRGGRVAERFCLPEEVDGELGGHCLEAMQAQRAVLHSVAAEPGAEPESVLCVPLVSKSEPFGVLCLARAAGQAPFAQEHLELATAFADQLAHSIYSERLLREKFESEHLAALGRMASRIVHDMNNPLTVLMGYTDLLLKTKQPPTMHDELLKRMLVQIDLMRQMLFDVLAYAGSRQKRPTREVDLWKLARDLVETWLPTPETEGVRLRFAGTGKQGVLGDELALGRALRNLVVNAVEAAAPSGTVTILVQAEKQDVVLEVADSGQGIPEEIRDTLFQPFVTHGKLHGTGLGLATTKNIVEEHGGTLTFDTGPHGTVFTARIPALRR